jgi:uncharacterized protein (TIGR00369 family)
LVDKEKIARQFMESIPHANELGLTLDHIGGGQAIISLPYDERLIGDPKTKVIHGGVVSTVIDTSCGAAVMSHPSAPGGTATIDLRIEYLRSARPGQTLVARATCHHVTRNVAFVQATATDDDTENPVASATGTFTLEKWP